MKRKIVFIFILFCVVSQVMAAPTEWPLQKKIHIQGGYASVASISVTPIASQAEAYKIGMPFSIDDPSVQDGKTERGRLIANWSTLANFQMLLDIEAEVMHHYSENESSKTPAAGDSGTTDVNKYDTGLGYELNFVYNISYATGSTVTYKKLEFPLTVPVKENGVYQKKVFRTDIDLLKGEKIIPGSLVGNADGQIFFHFDKETSDRIKTDFKSLPNGNYLATVTIKMKAAN